MAKKILTLDNLYQFFVEQDKEVHFSSKEADTPIVVTVPGNFEVEANDMPGLMKLKLKVCHTLLNRNGSFISEEHMKEAMPTLKYRPILAYIHNVDGVSDFYAHNIEITEDENGEEQINYLEKQVGCYTADDPYLEYDKDMDKTYVIANAVVPEEYTEAADIIRRKNGTKVSCELCIESLEYNAKEKYLDLTSFYFGGTTLLGCDENGHEIGEGMLGSRADIADFYHKEPDVNCQDKLVEVLEKLNITLEGFQNKNTIKEGGEGMDEFEKTVVEEEEVKEVDEAETTTETTTEEETTTEAEVSTSEDSGEETEIVETEACGGKKKKKCSVDEAGNITLEWELSHDDIRSALFNLLWAEDTWCWIIDVYDDKFIYQNEDECKFYRRGYTRTEDNISLSDEKTEVFNEWLSQTEKDALDALKNDYAVLKQYKSNMEQSQRDAIFASDKYVALKSSKAFAKLMEESKNYSVEECSQKADELLDDAKKLVEQFAVTKPVTEPAKPKTIGVPYNVKEKKQKSAYGNLFDKN